jgi:6-phosphogluconolactonase (cycloisomerase 2 family)
VLVETNRTENNIYTYIVGPGGVAETPTKTASADPNPFGPFGFAFDSAGNMIVADSNTSPDDSVSNPAGASSYSVSDTGTVLPETTFAPNTQNISCWMVVVGKYAYETNAIGATTLSQIPKVGPGTISSYSIGANGALTLAQGVAATLPGTPTIPGNFAVDEAASPDGKYLYVLDINLPPNIPDGAQVDTFAINGDGSLTYVGTSGPMPGGPGFAGMAASQSLVFTETNSATGNSVLMLSHSGGSLSVDQTVASGGKGVGFFLDSQGAVNASSDGRFVFAVNAGANSLSSFRIGQGGLTLVNTVPSNGAFPYSVTSFGNLVYVLNGSANTSFVPTGGSAGGTDEAGSISGYTVGLDGTLTPISGSTQPTGVGPREVRFDNSGKTLVVTNRTSNDIYTYPVGANGAAGAPVKSPSADPSPFGPFGFAFDGANHLIVADSNTGPMFAPNNPAGASSYNVNADGTLAPISSFVANGQNISCWVVIVGKFAYTTNPLGTTTVSQLPNLGPGTISSYRVHTDGRLTLAQGAAGVLPGVPGIPGNFAVDEAASTDGQYLYVLGINLPPSIPNPAEINTFAINGDGTLTYVGSTTSLPGGPGFTGLATT